VETKFDVIVIGELNIDLILNQIEGFPEVGKEILADKMTLTLGSSSAICASNLSSLGLKVAFIGKLGNDIFGRFIIDQLKDKGVDTSLIIIDDNLKTGATIALSYGEDRAMVTHQGAMSHLSIDDIDSKKLMQARHLHFSSYFFQPGFKNSLDTLFKKAKQAGLSTSLDVQWDPFEKWNLDLEKVLPFVDVFIPNEVELLNLTGQANLSSAINKTKNLSKYLIVKRGVKGSILCYEDKEVVQVPFLNKNVVDTIGAGDSFNAGFIFKFIHGNTPEKCQIFGNLTGAISTTKSGGTRAFTDHNGIMKIAKQKFNYTE